MQIDMVNFTPLPALLGGVLIGLAAALLILFCGRIAGVSSILGGFLRNLLSLSETRQNQWRLFFLIGLIVAPWAYGLFFALPVAEAKTSTPVLALAGALVGYGTRLSAGCTSGHGVCGLARLSVRSLAATLTFIATGIMTVYLVHQL